LDSYKIINNTRYNIERVFDERQTIDDIVTRNIMSKKGSSDWLTSYNIPIYNDIGGSMSVERMVQ
jgi:hypothetical protein